MYVDNSESRGILRDGLQLAWTLELLKDLSLLCKHKSVCLNAQLRQTPPPLKVFWVALVPVGFFGVLPMTFGEGHCCRDLLLGDVINKGHKRASLPIEMPVSMRRPTNNINSITYSKKLHCQISPGLMHW